MDTIPSGSTAPDFRGSWDMLGPKQSLQSIEHRHVYIYIWYILPETNIAPENGWLEYYFLFWKAYFQVRTVSFRENHFTVFGLSGETAPQVSIDWVIVLALISEEEGKSFSGVNSWKSMESYRNPQALGGSSQLVSG